GASARLQDAVLSMASATEILRILDQCCESYTFPMLDNGYVYPAASRLSTHHASDNWALVFELFGYSPRAGAPDTTIITFAGKLRNRDTREDYVSEGAYQNYLLHNPHNEFRSVWPIEDGAWIDSEEQETLSGAGVEFPLRGRTVRTPPVEAYDIHGIELSEPPRVMVFEFCRWLAGEHRDDVLATPEERRISLDPGLREVLVLD